MAFLNSCFPVLFVYSTKLEGGGDQTVGWNLFFRQWKCPFANGIHADSICQERPPVWKDHFNLTARVVFPDWFHCIPIILSDHGCPAYDIKNIYLYILKDAGGMLAYLLVPFTDMHICMWYLCHQRQEKHPAIAILAGLQNTRCFAVVPSKVYSILKNRFTGHHSQNHWV